MFYRDKRVVVVGGGDTAVKEAMFLTRFAREITLVHRRDRLRAAQILQDRMLLLESHIHVAWSTVVKEVLGDDHVEAVRLRDAKTGAERVLPCDGVFIYVGFTPNTEPFRDVVQIDAAGYIVTDEWMATPAPGIYAAGDCRRKPFRQIVTACGDGATAAFAAEQYLSADPSGSVRPAQETVSGQG
jgi:thioredoxin reductase (NADPH)